MFSKNVKIAVASIAIVAVLSSCGAKQPKYNYQIDMQKYENAISVTDKSYLVLVNKQNSLNNGYIPDSLATVPAELTLYGKEVQLESTAALAAEALVCELRACGYTDITITSGYRSYEYQQILFNTYLGNEMAAHPDWTQERCEAEVLSYSARPGESEHQTGLCMDLISTKNVVLDETFAQNPAYAWLIENAHHFGFILRYPADKTESTGYSYEPWHYRFVGVKAATEIHNKGISLEEYLD
ncbi:MAG: D-alanyl-D-alanine carboxypeptidase family protein [Ruminococcaceae bacterium]|nr:D-alanyl-D-alanine carboxypeptidase family protein [Oscillospiraceae bacterium]